ncbi:MAG: ABC-type transport auxiliary lipoprotein family protein, partial [Caldimonas sp.]
MKSEKPVGGTYRARRFGWFVALGLGLLTGCGSLLPTPPAPPALYVLDDTAAPLGEGLAKPLQAAAVSTLVVDVPRAAPGYGTRRIVYTRTTSELETFAYSQWVEPPALMLAPLLARAIERTGAFAAVVRAPTSVAGEYRLETELVRLQQDFSVAPSRVRLTLRAVLIETESRRVMASREFDGVMVSTSEDPAGG